MGARVLVVDDESSIRLGCERVLSGCGYQVESLGDGLSAVEAYKKEPYDLVLTDLNMPVMDGLTAVKKIREFDNSAVIVMITGFATIETAVQAIQDGAYDYVPKPFNPSELRLVSRRAIERKTLARERERSLRDLAFEQSRIKTIVTAMPDPVLVVNNDDQIVMWNPAARFLLANPLPPPGTALAEGASIGSLVNAFVDVKLRLNDQVRAVSIEVNDGRSGRTYLMNAAPIEYSPSGAVETSGMVMVFSDVTPMKGLERAKSRFVSIVSHELKAPIGAIKGYLELVLSDMDGSQKDIQEKLERCNIRAGQLQKLISELLDLSRIEHGKIERSLEKIEPLEIVTEVCSFLSSEAEKRDIKIHLPKESPGLIFADRAELNRVFTNLISNAIKYNRDSGEVTVSFQVATDTLQISVTDTGIGIPQEQLSQIGEEFYRIKTPETRDISGTGLGLAIVKRILLVNHATLQINSIYGEGTSFIISWPLSG